MKDKGPARRPSGPALQAGSSRRLLPDILSVLLVYVIAGTGLLVVGQLIFKDAPIDPKSSPSILLLGVLPLATLAVLAWQFRELLHGLRERRYGTRLRIKLALFFIGAIVAASLPQGIFTIRLTSLAGSELGSPETRIGLKAGLKLLLDYYDEDAARLEKIALVEMIPALERFKTPNRVLSELQSFDRRIEALEVFGPSGAYAGSGPPDARLDTPPATGITGALPAETRGGTSRLRYALARGASVVVVSLRLPDGFKEATASLADADKRAEDSVGLATAWPSSVAFLYGLFVLPLILLALLLGMATADFIAEPLASLEDATRRIASGDSAVRLLAKPGDETGWLIGSFNRMLDAMEKGKEGDIIQGRIDAWKDIAQRLAHELKNPLTPIRLASERVLRTARQDPGRIMQIVESSMLAVIAEVDSMDSLLQDFRAFASLPHPQRDWVELRELVEESVAVYKASYPEIRFEFENMPGEMRLRVDRAMIKRAIGNLLANSIEAMQGKGRIGIGADLVKTGDSGYIRLRLGDSGRGIPADIRPKVFLPYFTTRESGTGLGLAIVERIVQDHGGRIRFESAEGVGTVFYIDLPLEH